MKYLPALLLIFVILLAGCQPGGEERVTPALSGAPTATPAEGTALDNVTLTPSLSGETQKATPVVVTAIAVTLSPPEASDDASDATEAPSPNRITPTPESADDATGGKETPTPSQIAPTAVSVAGSGLNPSQLRYVLLDAYPNFFFCDPDYYPVATADEMGLALGNFDEIQADAEAYQAILEHLGLAGMTEFTNEQVLQIYREYKRLNAIAMERSGDRYFFQLRTKESESEGYTVSGHISQTGEITVDSEEPTVPTCPICLAVGTLIDTPAGPTPVEKLRAGDAVWTVDARGRRVATTIEQAGWTNAPAHHLVVHAVLADGRELWASAGHPTADGRTLGELRAGQWLDGTLVVSAAWEAYGAPATYDILPGGATGYYWANGVLLASTLR